MSSLDTLLLTLITFGILNFHEPVRRKKIFLTAVTIATLLLSIGIVLKVKMVNHYQLFFAPFIVLVLLKGVQQTFVDLTGREYELNIRGFKPKKPGRIMGSIDTIISITLLLTILVLLMIV